MALVIIMTYIKEDAKSGMTHTKKTGTGFSVAMVVLSAVLMSIVFYASLHNLVFLPLIVPSTFPFGLACVGLRVMRGERK